MFERAGHSAARKLIPNLAAAVTASAVYLSLFGLLGFYYRTAEPHFDNPLGTPILLRNDAMGEGHFGASRSNNRRHNGIDLSGAVGTPVRASKSGRAAFVGPKGGYGLYVRLDHSDGLSTAYAHMDEINIRQGAWVAKGTSIGLVGRTGNARHPAIRPHLHFEVRDGETPLDPTPLLGASA